MPYAQPRARGELRPLRSMCGRSIRTPARFFDAKACVGNSEDDPAGDGALGTAAGPHSRHVTRGAGTDVTRPSASGGARDSPPLLGPSRMAMENTAHAREPAEIFCGEFRATWWPPVLNFFRKKKSEDATGTPSRFFLKFPNVCSRAQFVGTNLR